MRLEKSSLFFYKIEITIKFKVYYINILGNEFLILRINNLKISS